MIEMLAVSYSLQMTGLLSHMVGRRVFTIGQNDSRFDPSGWKLPYQSEADAVDQAHRLADGYNRQFLRVLRQADRGRA
jgi:hypothetical protein